MPWDEVLESRGDIPLFALVRRGVPECEAVMRLSTAAMVTGCLVTACANSGSSDAGGSDGGRPIASNADFCATYATTFCASAARCGHLGAGQETNCETFFERNCRSHIGNRLRAGAAKLDLAAAQHCLDALFDRPCQGLDTREETATCRDEFMVVANAKAGEQCSKGADCLEGACYRPSGVGCAACTVGQGRLGELCLGFGACDSQT